MNATQKITDSLAAFFAEQDAKIADADVKWALERKAALLEFKQSARYAELNARGEWGGKYPAMFDICGGKTFFQIFNYNSDARVEEFMRKNAAATAEKRNTRIATKLLKAGVEEVISAEVAYTKDGFQGSFRINGERTVHIEAILAGGYNIQRLHQRVLVKIS